MKIENLRAVLHSFWIFNRSYILPGFFFSCLYISGDPKTEFRCPSGFKPAQTSLGKPNPLCEVMEEFQNRNTLEYSCLTSWNLDCQHASTQSVSFFRCTSFFGRLVSALFKSIYGVDSRGLCFGGRLGALLTLITVKRTSLCCWQGANTDPRFLDMGWMPYSAWKVNECEFRPEKCNKKNLRNALSAHKESVACWNAWNAWTTHRIPCLGHARSRGKLSSKPSRKLA